MENLYAQVYYQINLSSNCLEYTSETSFIVRTRHPTPIPISTQNCPNTIYFIFFYKRAMQSPLANRLMSLPFFEYMMKKYADLIKVYSGIFCI